jgi:glycosyltransferase involved in cell wall biosynthesis
MIKPRIYVAISTFYPVVGGAEKQALMQGRSLRERGFATTIITFRHNKTWLPCEVIEGVPVKRIAGSLLGWREKLPKVLQKLFYLLAMVIMGWTLWRHRQYYDILHIYQLNLLVLPAALACLFSGKPMVVSLRCADTGHNGRASTQTTLIAGPLDTHTTRLQISGLIHGESDLEGLERLGKPVARLTHALLQHVHAVVLVLSSRMLKDLAAHNFLLPNTQLIPNGVDSKHFHPETAWNENREQVVVCVAQLRYQKGIDVLLQAWRLVLQQLPQARLILVGNGPIQSQLHYMAQALEIAGSVEFAGEQKDVAAQFHRGAIAVLPSRFEGMPNALLEAMACGLACVAMRVSGSEDIIQHGVNGLLVESEDYQGLAQALLALFRDPRLAERYGREARATIEQHYALEHITDTYVELYARLVHSKLRVEGRVGVLPSGKESGNISS